MRIRVLGAHNTESSRTKLAMLLVDDVLALDAGGLTSSLSFTAQRRLKAVLLTHHHYDHIRDIPALAMNAYLSKTRLNIYSTASVRDTLAKHFLNDDVYPDFFRKPADRPVVNFTVMSPGRPRDVAGYRVTAMRVGHAVPAVSYSITASDGKTIFYSGDTGPDLAKCWRRASPDLIFIEVTMPNKYEKFALRSGHLTPALLNKELRSFKKLKGYLPRVIAVHLNPREQKEIAAELSPIGESLGCSIALAAEGMALDI